MSGGTGHGTPPDAEGAAAPAAADAAGAPFVKRAHLVALIGIDGAGKTTQAARLVAWLEARGETCTLHPNESLQSVKYALAHVAAAMGHEDAVALLGPETHQLVLSAIKWNTMAKAGGALARPGGFVLMDRYSYCQVAAARQQGLANAWMIERLFGVFPDPDLTIFVDVPPREAARRLAERASDRVPLPLSFIEGHAEAYRALPAARDFAVVDGTRPADAVHDEIVGHMLRRFPFLAVRP